MKGPRRIYKTVTVVPVDGGYCLRLDDKQLLTPGQKILTLPSERLAAAIAEEWRAQGEHIAPQSMPLTQLAVTAADFGKERKADIVKDVLGFAETDTVYFRVDEPPALRNLQDEGLDPLLAWLGQRWAVQPIKIYGIMPQPQPAPLLERLRRHLDAIDHWRLVALNHLARCTGSLTIPLALSEGHITPEQAWDVSQIDEAYQISLWGEDPEIQAQRTALRGDIIDTARYLMLLA